MSSSVRFVHLACVAIRARGTQKPRLFCGGEGNADLAATWGVCSRESSSKCCSSAPGILVSSDRSLAKADLHRRSGFSTPGSDARDVLQLQHYMFRSGRLARRSPSENQKRDLQVFVMVNPRPRTIGEGVDGRASLRIATPLASREHFSEARARTYVGSFRIL